MVTPMHDEMTEFVSNIPTPTLCGSPRVEKDEGLGAHPERKCVELLGGLRHSEDSYAMEFEQLNQVWKWSQA